MPAKEAAALLVILKDKDKVKLHTAALDAIGKIGPKDTKELLEIMTPTARAVKGFETRRKALAVLGQTRGPMPGRRPDAATAAQERDVPQVRRLPAATLKSIGLMQPGT